MTGNYNFQPKGSKSDQGWYDRGYIPHFDGGAVPQFITFRLADSLPGPVVENLIKESDGSSDSDAAYRKKLEKFLDRGYGDCWLARGDIASTVADAIRFLDGSKYSLFAWVIMPNHVHMLARPAEGIELSSITHSIKSYTAHEANKLLGRRGQFWQHESFDRYIRNPKHFVGVADYIENNPVKAGLCEHRSQWRWSSAYCEELPAGG